MRLQIKSQKGEKAAAIHDALGDLTDGPGQVSTLLHLPRSCMAVSCRMSLSCLPLLHIRQACGHSKMLQDFKQRMNLLSCLGSLTLSV